MALSLLGLAIASAGCVPLRSFIVMDSGPPAPSSEVCQVVATWLNRVHYEPDPANGGVPTPGLVGRLYLFGSEVKEPLVGDGAITVDLYDDSGPQPGDQPLERWYIDPATLQRLCRQDIVGWGYTLVLPWSSYKRDITRVHMTVRYEPQHGTPLYAPSSPLTLEHPMPPTGRPPVESPPGVPPIAPPAPPVPPVNP